MPSGKIKIKKKINKYDYINYFLYLQPHILNATTEWLCNLCAPKTYRAEKCSPKKISLNKKVTTSNNSLTPLTKLPYNVSFSEKFWMDSGSKFCHF